mmetsp:Transcript_33052/g.92548  ORF Transcript_33052/g.92548 Transcript_33052/m.92548 type:complete len:97 (-) Transcript_33052:198-488(-)
MEDGGGGPVASGRTKKKSGSSSSVTKKRRKRKLRSVDFGVLEVPALKRYKKHFRVRMKHNPTKADLVAAVTKHFAELQYDPHETITTFTHKIVTRR